MWLRVGFQVSRLNDICSSKWNLTIEIRYLWGHLHFHGFLQIAIYIHFTKNGKQIIHVVRKNHVWLKFEIINSISIVKCYLWYTTYNAIFLFAITNTIIIIFLLLTLMLWRYFHVNVLFSHCYDLWAEVTSKGNLSLWRCHSS